MLAVKHYCRCCCIPSGSYAAWCISHQEFLSYQCEGLLSIKDAPLALVHSGDRHQVMSAH
jgi:hypothetical protein